MYCGVRSAYESSSVFGHHGARYVIFGDLLPAYLSFQLGSDLLLIFYGANACHLLFETEIIVEERVISKIVNARLRFGSLYSKHLFKVITHNETRSQQSKILNL